jgi:SPP1 gp7 family putative phage head morphogenesis protein
MKTILKSKRRLRPIRWITHKLKDLFAPVVKATKSGLQKSILRKSLDFVSGIEWPETNPDKLLDDKGLDSRLYDAMMMDDRISSIVELKIRLALAVNGEFVPASEEEKDVEINEFIDTMFYSMSIRWWDVLYNLLEGGIVHGFKVGERMFDMVDGKIIIRNIKFMHSLFFDFEYNEWGDLDKMIIGKRYGEGTPIGQPELDNKFIIFTYPYLKNGNYYGDSDLREVYPQYYAKYQIFRFRNIYLQNYGQPIPIVTYDSARVEQAEKDEMESFLQNLQDNMYLMIPGLRLRDKFKEANEKLSAKFEVSLLENKKTNGTDQYEKTINQLDAQISRKLLVPDKMGFTQDGTGARAQSEVFFDVLKMVIKDLHGRIEDTVNTMIEQVVDLNFPGVEEYPTWQFEKIDEKIETEMLKQLITLGVVDKREAWIRPWTGIPELTQEEQDEIEKKQEEDRKKAAEDFAQQAGGPPFQKKPAGVPKGADSNVPKQGAEKNKNEGIRCLKTDFKKIEKQYDIAEADFVRDFMLIHKSISENVVRQVERKKIIENKDLKALKTVRVSKTDLKRLMSMYYAKLYLEGKTSAIDAFKDALPKATLTSKPPFATEPPHSFLIGEDWLDRQWIDRYLRDYGELGVLSKADRIYLSQIKDRAFFLTGDIEQQILKDVHTHITSGLDNGLTARTIINQIDSALTADRRRYATTIARTNASDAFNSGRMNFFMGDIARPLIEAYQYSAIIDNVTTLFCESHDGQIIYPNDPQFGITNPPNHFNCRSLLIPILVGEGQNPNSPYNNYKEELETWGTGVQSKFRLPAEGFGGIAKAEGGWG